MKEININQLKSHPCQVEVYGEESVDSDLVQSIRAKGILQPLIVTEKNEVLSGNRRWKAGVKAGLKAVPVDVRSGLDILEQESFIIESNLQRTKTARQLGREAIKLKEIEAERSKQRMVAAQNNKRAAMLNIDIAAKEQPPPKGATTAIVGAKLGMSRGTVEKLIEVEEKIEELESKGQVEEAKKLEKTLTKKSINAAHSQIKPKPKQKESQPMVPKAAIEMSDDLPGITEEWVRGKQWELNTLIMRKLTGKDEGESRRLLGRLVRDVSQSAVMGAMAIAGNNMNYIKSEMLEPFAYVKAIANSIKVSGNGKVADKPDKNRQLIERMIQERS